MDKVRFRDRFAALLDKSIFVLLLLLFASVPFSTAAAETFRGISIFLFLLLVLLKRGKCLKADSADIFAFSYLLLALASVFYSPYFHKSLWAFLGKALDGVAIYFVVRNYFYYNPGKTKYLFIAILISSCVVSLDGFYQYFFGHDLFRGAGPDVFFKESLELVTRRITACMKYPTSLGVYLACSLPFHILFLAKTKNTKARIFLGICVLAVSLAMMLTYTRSSLLGILLSVILLFAVFKKKSLVLWVLPFALFIFLAPKTAIFLRTVAPNAQLDDSIKDRLGYYKDALDLISRNYVFGNGINTYDTLNKELHPGRPKYAYVHNCYLQMCAELGLVGLGLFILFLSALFLRFFKSIRKLRLSFSAGYPVLALVSFFASLLILLVAFVFDTHFYETVFSVLFWYSCGIIAALASRKQDLSG